MILLPVIARELGFAARQPFTYHLRLLGVTALLVVFVLFALRSNLGPGIGRELFSYFHGTVFFTIWVLVPLATADSISRERREGTLPLLFLTPLKSSDIVYAKAMVHGLRALSLWLAVVPILTICFVAGGVGWPEMLISTLVNFSAICLAMAAGLLASVRTRIWTRALALAAGFALGLMLVFIRVLSPVVTLIAGRAPRGFFGGMQGAPPLVQGFVLTLNFQGYWQHWLGSMRRGPAPLLSAFVVFTILTLIAFFLLSRFAAWNLKRTWQEHPPSARRVWLERRLFQPVFFANALRRWLRWELQRNPIGWLERRSWSGRLVVWSWFAVVTCVYTSLFANLQLYQHSFDGMQIFVASLLVGGLALSAATSFRRERETGVLELLLVAPLREWQIVTGRVRGLWSQFMPAAVLLLGVWLYGGTFLVSTGRERITYVIFFAVSFLTLPVVGLYFSLAKSNLMVALLWTLATGVLVPTGLVQAVEGVFGLRLMLNLSGHSYLLDLLIASSLQIAIALFLAQRLHRNLRCRQFAAAKTG